MSSATASTHISHSGGRTTTMSRSGLKSLLRGFTQGAWRATSWMIAALLSCTVVVLTATHSVSIGLSMVGQTVSFTGASGGSAAVLVSAAVMVLGVLVGFCCWGAVVVIKAVWRARVRLLISVGAQAVDVQISPAATPAGVAVRRNGDNNHSRTDAKEQAK